MPNLLVLLGVGSAGDNSEREKCHAPNTEKQA